MTDVTYESTSKTLTTPQGDLHYHEAGDGPPLLLLHGSGPGVSGWANYRGNLPTFARHFRCLVLDMPGFGKSYAPDESPAMHAPDAVLAFLDELGLDKVPIVGNSMGGGVAARLAAAHPDRVTRLVTIGGVGVPFFSPVPAEGIILLVEFVEDPTRDRLLKWMTSMVYDPAILTDEFVEMRWTSATDADPGPDVADLGARRPGHASRRLDCADAIHPEVRATRFLRLRALGDDRAQGRVRERRAVVSAPRSRLTLLRIDPAPDHCQTKSFTGSSAALQPAMYP
jgi:pimeloyl-ACP methyl ester carboxylesterase